MFVAVRLQRCGGSQCAPGTCDHDESRKNHRSGACSPGRSRIWPADEDVLCAPALGLAALTGAGTEKYLGHDFGQVRVTNDAAQSTGQVPAYSLGEYAVRQQRRVQLRLKVGAPGDKYEEEADRLADIVIGTPGLPAESGEAVPNRTQTSFMREECSECEDDSYRQDQKGFREEVLQRRAKDEHAFRVSYRVQSQVDRVRGGGQPLAGSVRSYFESRFGYDFGKVRIHTGPYAAAAAQSMNARAFAVGTDVGFDAGQFSPDTTGGKRLLAHELVHVVQQGGASARPVRSKASRLSTPFQRTGEQAGSQESEVIERAGDPAAIPLGLRCPTDLTPGRPAGTDLLFPVGRSTITPAHTVQLGGFLATWLASGGTDDIVVHGYASTQGDQGPNWALSCDRAEAVQAELVRLGIPAVRVSVVAHGESTDFSSSSEPNQRAVVTMRSAGSVSFPIVGGILTPRDNFAGRSATRFSVGEVIDLSFASLPARPAAAFGGLQWHLASGGGTLSGTTIVGTGTYTAPGTAGAVRLELRVATGATSGRVVSAHPITIVIPSGVRITEVPGTAPNFRPGGVIPPGTWGAGFLGNVFVDPKDVSFQGVVFGEGTVAAVVTGSFLSPFAGVVHPVNTFGPAHGGNAATGTPVSPPQDQISGSGIVPTGSFLGLPICGASDFLWAIPWEFSVAGGPRTFFATANHHMTSTFLCAATIEKGGAGPFWRPI
ncbi:MAG: eCIS core domain-containing protein [bacterium]